MFACWIPILLAGYPGFFSYDSGMGDLMQWAQIESGTLNAHHSVLHTLIVEALVKTGMALFGSFNAGICLLVVIQALVVATLLSFSLYWLVEDGMGRPGFIGACAFFALDPIIGMFALCTTKDTLFSAVMVAHCLLLVRLHAASNARSPLDKMPLLAGIAAFGFLLCVLRTNAIVALVVFAPLVFLVMRRQARKAFALCTASSLVLAALWLGPVSAALGVQSSPIGAWNALGIPMQQVARCATSPAVAAEDKSQIDAVLGDVKYKQNLSDVSRDAFMTHRGSTRDLIGLYINLGIRYPVLYLEAALLHTEDAWSPFATIDAYNEQGDGYSSVFDFRTMEPGTMQPIAHGLSEISMNLSSSAGAERIPGVHFITSIAVYLFAMMTCLTRAVIKRDRAALCHAIPMAVLSLSNIMGPCMVIRYFLYLIFALPSFLHFILYKRSTAP